jgi:hypothetical protein
MQNKSEYDLDLKEWKKREGIFTSNTEKMHAIIIEDFCSVFMEEKLNEYPDFGKAMTADFTVMLKRVSEVMYQSNDATNPFWSLVDTLGRLINMKQNQGESLYAYKDRIDQEAGAVKAKLGANVLAPFVQSTDKYKKASQTEQQKQVDSAFEVFISTCYLRGCDRDRYQSLIDDLRSQYTRDNDQYPQTVDKAMTLLSKHRHDNRKTRKNNKYNGGGEKVTSFFQREGKKCYCCGSDDHILPNCPEKGKRAKKDWVKPSFYRDKYAKQQQQHLQSEEDDGDDDASEDYPSIGWSNAHVTVGDEEEEESESMLAKQCCSPLSLLHVKH